MPFCSLCGVSFGTSEQVRGHIQGSKGEHLGIGYADAEQYITESPPDDDNDADPPGGAAGGPADESLSSQAQVGLSIPEAKAEASPSAGQNNDPTCPECGSNRWFDASEHTDYPRACADCSDESSWMVYGDEEAA
jgi:hypothetical protein